MINDSKKMLCVIAAEFACYLEAKFLNGQVVLVYINGLNVCTHLYWWIEFNFFLVARLLHLAYHVHNQMTLAN